jgi:hypothetical protein
LIMSAQEPLEDKILPLLEKVQSSSPRSFRAIVARLHYPHVSGRDITYIADTSESLGAKATRSLREVGWDPDTKEDLTLLLDLYSLTLPEKTRAAQLLNKKSKTVSTEKAGEETSESVKVSEPDIPSFSKMISNDTRAASCNFIGYGKWVLNRKRSEASYRVKREVVVRLLELFPEFERTRNRIGGVIYSCISNMHYEELEKFCEYYMDEEKTAQYVYNWKGHEGHNAFSPLMIYPNLDPVVAQMVSLSEDHMRDWRLLEELNKLTPFEQKRLINPPTQYKKYVVYPNPQNQYELAGFDVCDISNRDFIVAKSSLQSDDVRTKLLNCIKIIQSRFPSSEAGCQEMRRLTDCLIQICMAGDKKEIGIWHDAFIQAPITSQITMECFSDLQSEILADPKNLPADDSSTDEETDDMELEEPNRED